MKPVLVILSGAKNLLFRFKIRSFVSLRMTKPKELKLINQTEKGFLLMEAMVLILMISVTFTAFIGVIAQGLKISSRSRAQTDAVSKYEFLLFELENGFRPDFLNFGGREEVEGGYQYSVQNEQEEDSYAFLKNKLAWKNGKESLEFALVLPEKMALQ